MTISDLTALAVAHHGNFLRVGTLAWAVFSMVAHAEAFAEAAKLPRYDVIGSIVRVYL